MTERYFIFPNGIQAPIFYSNAQWAVTKYGIESLTTPYEIERDRLTERAAYIGNWCSDWVVHLADKIWVDVHLFADALRHALLIHKVRGRTLIDIDASVDRALKEREKHADFKAFCENELGGHLGQKTANGWVVDNMADMAAAGQLYEEYRRAKQ
jgi:hypothetical protein